MGRWPSGDLLSPTVRVSRSQVPKAVHAGRYVSMTERYASVVPKVPLFREETSHALVGTASALP